MAQASTDLNLVDASKLTKWEIGHSNSIIKKISYKQVENQSMKAKQDENIVKAFNSQNGLVMIPQLYNVDITSFGLVDFYPGMSFFVKPTLIGVGDISNSPVFREVGLTGLYNVINVEHKIASTGFETSFKCYNEAVLDWSSAIEAMRPKSKAEQRKILEDQASAAQANVKKTAKKRRAADIAYFGEGGQGARANWTPKPLEEYEKDGDLGKSTIEHVKKLKDMASNK